MTRRNTGTNRSSQSHNPTKSDISTPESIRIDKWLWAARFYKTRSLASDAVKSGKVCIDGEKIKPSKEITINTMLSIKRSPYNTEVVVLGISHRRGPATVAATLYEETPDSVKNQQRLAQIRQSQPAMRPSGQGRPTKRERRQIISFTSKPEE